LRPSSWLRPGPITTIEAGTKAPPSKSPRSRRFPAEDEAAAAYDRAAFLLLGPAATLNFDSVPNDPWASMHSAILLEQALAPDAPPAVVAMANGEGVPQEVAAAVLANKSVRRHLDARTVLTFQRRHQQQMQQHMPQQGQQAHAQPALPEQLEEREVLPHPSLQPPAQLQPPAPPPRSPQQRAGAGGQPFQPQARAFRDGLAAQEPSLLDAAAIVQDLQRHSDVSVEEILQEAARAWERRSSGASDAPSAAVSGASFDQAAARALLTHLQAHHWPASSQIGTFDTFEATASAAPLSSAVPPELQLPLLAVAASLARMDSGASTLGPLPLTSWGTPGQAVAAAAATQLPDAAALQLTGLPHRRPQPPPLLPRAAVAAALRHLEQLLLLMPEVVLAALQDIGAPPQQLLQQLPEDVTAAHAAATAAVRTLVELRGGSVGGGTSGAPALTRL
jgi:hypothetical protein